MSEVVGGGAPPFEEEQGCVVVGDLAPGTLESMREAADGLLHRSAILGDLPQVGDRRRRLLRDRSRPLFLTHEKKMLP